MYRLLRNHLEAGDVYVSDSLRFRSFEEDLMLRRAVAYAYSGRLRVKTDLEQQIWSECSRLLANCVIYYNACILSEWLKRKEIQGNPGQIKRVSPVSWKHINFYGEYHFCEASEGIDLAKMVDEMEAFNGDR